MTILERFALPRELRPARRAARPAARPKDVFLQPQIRHRREIRLTQVGLLITGIAAIALTWQLGRAAWGNFAEGRIAAGVGVLLFLAIAMAMVYGNLVYQLTRIGYRRRLQVHRPAGEEQLATLFTADTPSLTVLVPSYKEDPQVVWRTLMSAALQDYPDKRVVLLIDDPPEPGSESDRQLLDTARVLPHELQVLLDRPARHFAERLADLEAASGELVAEVQGLAEAHLYAAEWFARRAAQHEGDTHSDALFVEQTYLAPAETHRARARELQQNVDAGAALPTLEGVRAEYRRLAARFRVTLTSFQRKRYVNLSREANKAMNLNSYLGLMGRHWRAVPRADGLHLTPAEAGGLYVPRTDYVITLDADSILAPQYALRLVHFAQQPENARVAVVQTPYSAEPNPPGLLERIAGATTDIQYLIHQGFTRWNATFWVGANALLRTSALDEIAVEEQDRGFTVRRYIQDRTVIEDTESSIDLAARGWRLHNYPERLSHSATPADFGSLLIQRRRWANGGLIILPKFLGYVCARHFFRRAGEGFFRLHYLTSTALVNLGLPILLLVPFEENLRSIWFPLTCLPYYLLYTRDLVQAGYRASDVLRVYALNLMLVGVNLGGVLKSMQQAWTGEKIPFKRTPKVAGRTAAPGGYVLLIWAAIAYCGLGCAVDAAAGRWFHASFSLLNGGFLAYAAVVFIGWRASWEDVFRTANREMGGMLNAERGTLKVG